MLLVRRLTLPPERAWQPRLKNGFPARGREPDTWILRRVTPCGSWRNMADHERPARSPSGGAIMFTFESFTTLMVGAMAIPTLALLVIGLSTPQVAPDHMRH